MAEPRKLLVIGLGNVLCGDDGLGVAAVEQFCGMYELPETSRRRTAVRSASPCSPASAKPTTS